MTLQRGWFSTGRPVANPIEQCLEQKRRPIQTRT